MYSIGSVNILSLRYLTLHENYILKRVEESLINKNKMNLLAFDFRHVLYASELSRLSESEWSLVYPDSTGIFLLLKLFYFNKTKSFKRIVSTNLHTDILRLLNECKSKIFLIGDTHLTQEKFREKINFEYKNIRIVGWIDGFKKISNREIVSKIMKSNSDVLMIGMGVPKQELILSEISELINTPLRITVGAFFSFYSGRLKRAPAIMQKLYLEWLFRLVQEPFRLISRYFIQFPRSFIKIMRYRLNENRDIITKH